MTKILRFLSNTIGFIFVLLGSFGILFGIIDMIDPVGSKMADDGDPFGVPHNFAESFSLTLVYVLVFCLGIGLILGFKKIAGLSAK
ncbi:MAG TPA: hypothetical protein VNB22_03465 [Pyrinomonadaceae bacterium]|nr:hypothetical protein [Pyrinomonadaceae bacterium]